MDNNTPELPNPVPILITKTCSKCKTEQPLENYRKNPSTRDKLQNECKICNTLRNKDFYQKNKKRIIKKVMGSRKKKERLSKEIKKLQKQVELTNKEYNPEIIQNPPVSEN